MPDQPDSEPKSMAAQLPHFSMRAGAPRPPAKPFFKTTSAEKSVSEKAALERPSGDRSFIERMGVMAPTSGYTPQQRRALESGAEDKALTIGKHIKVSGEISGCERLIVEGEVDAVISGLTRIDIAAGGRVAGTATAETVVVHGSFDGTLIVRGHLDIATGASVRGTISYKTVTVVTGAKLAGTIAVLED
jgi:cytoskeletal protein CcmA (bactofilin family)